MKNKNIKFLTIFGFFILITTLKSQDFPLWPFWNQYFEHDFSSAFGPRNLGTEEYPNNGYNYDFHHGIDIAAPQFTPFYKSDAVGIVKFVGGTGYNQFFVVEYLPANGDIYYLKYKHVIWDKATEHVDIYEGRDITYDLTIGWIADYYPTGEIAGDHLHICYYTSKPSSAYDESGAINPGHKLKDMNGNFNIALNQKPELLYRDDLGDEYVIEYTSLLPVRQDWEANHSNPSGLKYIEIGARVRDEELDFNNMTLSLLGTGYSNNYSTNEILKNDNPSPCNQVIYDERTNCGDDIGHDHESIGIYPMILDKKLPSQDGSHTVWFRFYLDEYVYDDLYQLVAHVHGSDWKGNAFSKAGIMVEIPDGNEPPPPQMRTISFGEHDFGELAQEGESELWVTPNISDYAFNMKTTLDEFDPGNDFEIYGRCGSDPTTSNYDWKWDSKDNGKVEATHQFPETGTWHIMAYSAAGSGSYRILCDLDYDDQEPTIENLSAIYENDGTSVGSNNLQNKTVMYDLVLHTYDEENGEQFQVSIIEYICYLEGETEPDPIVVFDASQPDVDNVYLGDHKYALTNHSAVGGHLEISGYDDNTHLVIKAVVYDHFIESRSKSITETYIIGTIPDNVIPIVHNVYLTEETNETDAPYDDKYNNKILERTKYDIIVEVSDLDAYENPQEVKKIEYQYYPYLNESTQEFEWSPWFVGFEKNISNIDIIYAHGDNPDPNNNNHYKYVLTNHDVNNDENGYLDFTDATKFPEEESFKIKIKVDDIMENPSGEIYQSNWDYSIVYEPLDINNCVKGEELAYYFTLEDDQEEDAIKKYRSYGRQLLPYGTDMDFIVRAHSKRCKYNNEIEKFDIQKIEFKFRSGDYSACIIGELTTTARNHYFTTQESMREFMYADDTDPANGIFEYIVTNGNNPSSDNGTLNFPQSWQMGETVETSDYHRKYVNVYDWYGNMVVLEDGLNYEYHFFVVKPDDYDWAVHENVPESSILINNYPNPFNNNTKIDYKIFLKADIEVSIYNIMGQKIKILEKCQKLEGSYSLTWNGQDDNNRDVPSGIYFCVIRAQNLNKSTKLIVLR